MKIITVGANHLFPEFPLGEKVDFELSQVSSGASIHILTFKEVEYLFEIKKAVFINKKEFLITGFIVDDRKEKRLGEISFVFIY